MKMISYEIIEEHYERILKNYEADIQICEGVVEQCYNCPYRSGPRTSDSCCGKMIVDLKRYQQLHPELTL